MSLKKLRVTGLGEGSSPVTDEFPSNTEMFPFDDVIMFSHDIHMMAVRHA